MELLQHVHRILGSIVKLWYMPLCHYIVLESRLDIQMVNAGLGGALLYHHPELRWLSVLP